MFQEDDDGDFMSPASSSKLSSLFGTGPTTGQDSSLKYVAPKEPKKAASVSGSKDAQAAASAVIFATAVQTYKFIQDGYVSQGKAMAAILSSSTDPPTYKLLLYVSKQQQLTNATVTSTFSFTIQDNNYASFYDDGSNSWSILFGSADAVSLFAKNICYAKAMSEGGALDSIIYQDLSSGEGATVQNGNYVELRYTAWTVENKSIGQEFDSNASSDKLLRCKVGKGKVIKGIDESLLTMKPGSHRYIVLPARLATGSKSMMGSVPPNTTVMYDVEVVRVKASKALSSTHTSASSSRVPTPTPTDDPTHNVTAPPPSTTGASTTSTTFPYCEGGQGESPATTVASHQQQAKSMEDKTKNIEEQLHQGLVGDGGNSTDKARLISRMARMGQPMLAQAVAPVSVDPTTTGTAVAGSEQSRDPPQSPGKPGIARKPPHLISTTRTPPTQHASSTQGGNAATSTHTETPHRPPAAAAGSHIQPIDKPLSAAPQQNAVSPAVRSVTHTTSSSHTSAVQPTAASVGLVDGHLSMFQPPMAMQNPYAQMAGQFPGMYPQQAQPDGYMSAFMSEARQHNTEIRLSVNRVADKMDTLTQKVEQQLHNTHQTYLGSAVQTQHNTTPAALEAHVLMSSIQNIVQENTDMKEKLEENKKKIEIQNEKISELLYKSQMYMEKSNTLMEQRNESLTQATTQSQDKILALEQDKVKLTFELSTMQTEVLKLKEDVMEREAKRCEFNARLESLIDTNSRLATENDLLKQQHAGITQQLTELRAQHNKQSSECTAQKAHIEQLTAQLTQIQQQHNTQAQQIESTESLKQNLQDVRDEYEKKIEALTNKLTSLTSTDKPDQGSVQVDYEEQLTAMKVELIEKHNKQIEVRDNEVKTLQETVKDLQEKAKEQSSVLHERNELIRKTTAELKDYVVYKEKYEYLREQAVAMREHYESQASEQSHDTEHVVSEVKRVMSSVFHSLKAEFDSSESYTGSDIHSTVLETIKIVTLRLTEESVGESDDEESDSESDASNKEEQDPEAEGTVQLQEVSHSAASTATGDIVDGDSTAATEEITPMLSPPVTGDKGNPLYEEMLRKDDDEWKESNKCQTEQDDKAELPASRNSVPEHPTKQDTGFDEPSNQEDGLDKPFNQEDESDKPENQEDGLDEFTTQDSVQQQQPAVQQDDSEQPAKQDNLTELPTRLDATTNRTEVTSDEEMRPSPPPMSDEDEEKQADNWMD